MKKFITNLFLQSNFTHQECGTDLLLTYDDFEEKRSYWLLAEREDLNFIDEQTEVFNRAKIISNKPDFDKNCSLLLLIKLSFSTQQPSLKKQLLKIEDNPYYFKKYVLFYHEDEYQELLNTKEHKTELEFLKFQMTNRDCFNIYKADPKASNWQSLVYRMVLKLPFIDINIKVKSGLKVLFDDNKQKLVRKGYSEHDNLISNYLNDLTPDEIVGLKPIEILTSLNLKQLSNGNQDLSGKHREL